MKLDSHQPGAFCWAELQTSDAAAAKAFYAALLGWTYTDNPMGPDMVYTMADVNGAVSGALFNDPSGNQPVGWNSYICVSNADEATAKAKNAGGNVISEPFDVMTVGRMSIVADPKGAVFQLWEPRQHIGYQIVNEVGSVCWNELLSSDTAAAEKFYTEMFGYTADHMDMGVPYTVFMNGEAPAAGMVGTTREVAAVNNTWVIYFKVVNCSTGVETVKSMGGSVLYGPTAVPGVGDVAMVTDPQGATFGIISE